MELGVVVVVTAAGRARVRFVGFDGQIWAVGVQDGPAAGPAALDPVVAPTAGAKKVAEEDP